MKNDWFKDWFASKFYLEVYSHRNESDAIKLFNLIQNNVVLSNNSKILDVACGNGRHSNYFAKLGYNVTGFDLSAKLLKIAQKSKLESYLQSNFFCADVRLIPIKANFDLILNLFTSFGYFDNDVENFSFIKFASEHLNQNGFFVFDYLNPNFLKNNIVESSEKEIGDLTILEKRRINDKRIEKEIIIKDSENMHRFFESVQLYSYNEILKVFNNNGFTEMRSFGSYSEDIYDENESERMIIIFKK
jgi:SAM-dependent methyltransferase